MNRTTSSAVCPLCKKPLGPSLEGQAVSRLCDDCKSMVDTIKPNGAGSSPVAGSRPAQMSPLTTPAQAQVTPAQTTPVQTQTTAEVQQSAASDFRQIAEAAGAEVSAAPPVFLVPEGGQPAPRMPAVDVRPGEQAWPIVVDGAEKKRIPVTLIVVGVVFLSAVAAGVYVFRTGMLASLFHSRTEPKSRAANTPPKQLPPVRPAVSPGTKGQVPTASPTSTGNPVSTVNQSITGAASQSPAPTATGQAAAEAPGMKFTAFQLASFPNQSGAHEFLEKLVRAGIPGYTVSAEIPHRGRWYRVRAGKFSSAKEEKEFGDTWRQRARAAGITIQLVHCDYEQPQNGN